MRTDAGYVFLATQLFRFGRDETMAIDYLKQLHPNVAAYPGDVAQVVAMVARGDAAGRRAGATTSSRTRRVSRASS